MYVRVCLCRGDTFVGTPSRPPFVCMSAQTRTYMTYNIHVYLKKKKQNEKKITPFIAKRDIISQSSYGLRSQKLP